MSSRLFFWKKETIVRSEGLKWCWRRGSPVLFGETHEYAMRSTLLQQTGPGSVFYDVGANVGAYTLPAAKKGARVVSFEPSPSSADRLRRNLRENGLDATILTVALSDSVGVFNTSERYLGALPQQSTNLWVKVPLDLIAPDLPFPNVVKIDVEGQEIKVLSGARETIRRHRPTLYVEYHPHFGVPRNLVTEFYESVGYKADELGHRIILGRPSG